MQSTSRTDDFNRHWGTTTQQSISIGNGFILCSRAPSCKLETMVVLRFCLQTEVLLDLEHLTGESECVRVKVCFLSFSTFCEYSPMELFESSGGSASSFHLLLRTFYQQLVGAHSPGRHYLTFTSNFSTPETSCPLKAELSHNWWHRWQCTRCCISIIISIRITDAA